MRLPRTARMLGSISAAAVLLLPSAAGAVEGDASAAPAAPVVDVLPLLGSTLTVALTTQPDGTISSVTVDSQVLDVEQPDDEVSFVFAGAAGSAEATTVEFQDSDEAPEAAEAPEATEAPEAEEAPEAPEAPEADEG